jgi:hypothetical protein
MRSRKAVLPAIAAVVLALALCPTLANAQASTDYAAVKGMDERFRIDLGGFFQKFDTTLRLDSETGRGTEVNLEDDLGLSSDQVNFRVDAYWRFGRHGRLHLGYTGWNRNADHTIDRDIKIGDTTYHAGASLDSRLKVSLVELYYGYSFWNTGKFELGAQLGLSAMFNKARFEGTGTISGGGGSTSGSFSSEDRSLTAPLPAIGVQASYTIIPKLIASARIRGLGATIDNVKASSLQWRAYLDYYPWKNVGLGLSYDYLDIKIEKQKSVTVEFDYKYSGPMAYVSLVF